MDFLYRNSLFNTQLLTKTIFKMIRYSYSLSLRKNNTIIENAIFLNKIKINIINGIQWPMVSPGAAPSAPASAPECGGNDVM